MLVEVNGHITRIRDCEFPAPEERASTAWESIIFRIGGCRESSRLIRWWAQAMRGMGEKLAEVRAFFIQNSSPDPENNTFKTLRAWNTSAGVITHEESG